MKQVFGRGLSLEADNEHKDYQRQEINTEKLIIDFGKFTGTYWTRCEIDYLKWLLRERVDRTIYIKQVPHPVWAVAEAELKRRKVNLNDKLYITAHAVERATERYFREYCLYRECAENKGKVPGVYSWLTDIATGALKKAKFSEEKTKYLGMVFVFEQYTHCDVLKTVM